LGRSATKHGDEPESEEKGSRITTTVELLAIADKLGADDGTIQALVLLAGWCGLRFREVSELSRKDFDADCKTATIWRAGTHRLTMTRGAASTP
jgi:integrase